MLVRPTAVAAAGIKQSPGKPLDGVNLLPFVTGKEPGRPHQTLYWQSGDVGAVRDGDLKLVIGESKTKVADPKAGEPALYDLLKDASETQDLAPQRPEEVKRLLKLYEDWKRDFPKPLWGHGSATDDDV